MIHAEKLRKQYATVLAVDSVSLSVHPGKIFGLIGPNGAGKTTTIRMLLNIIAPDEGTVTYHGAPFSAEIQNRIGYVPEERGLYRKNKLFDTILYFASLRGINGSNARQKTNEWLRRFELVDYAQKKVEELSKGNQQKVQFITAIIHDPEYIVLDEPFSGLDPVNQILLKDILQELKDRQKCIIFSTHQMESAEKLCDEICLINKGQIVLEGDLKEVKARYGRNAVRIEFDGDGSFLEELPVVRQSTVYENYAELVLNDTTSSKSLLTAIANSIEVRKFEYVEPSLNTIFLNVVGAASQRDVVSPAPSVPVYVPPTVEDKELRKARLSVILAGLMTFFFAVMILKREDYWSMAALMGAATVFSAVRYLMMRKKLRKKQSVDAMEGRT